jgi:hypothetical protein
VAVSAVQIENRFPPRGDEVMFTLWRKIETGAPSRRRPARECKLGIESLDTRAVPSSVSWHPGGVNVAAPTTPAYRPPTPVPSFNMPPFPLDPGAVTNPGGVDPFGNTVITNPGNT